MITFSLSTSSSSRSDVKLSSSSSSSLSCDTSRDLNQKCSAASRKDICGRNFVGLFINLSTCFIMFRLVSDVFCLQSLKNRYGTVTVISAKPCQNALGQFGTCMFMWDCIKSEGVHLGTCSDRFLFGSCCYHNASLLNPIEQNNQQQNQGGTNLTTSYQASGLMQSGGVGVGGALPNSSEESHSRPQSSNDVKFFDRPTSSATEAPPQAATVATATSDILVVKPTKPDQIFLSSQSLPIEHLDYVTTSSASNSSSSGDHVISLAKDHLHPAEQQTSTDSKNQALVNANDDPSANLHSEVTSATTATPTTTLATTISTPTTMTSLNTSLPQPTIASNVIVNSQQPMSAPQQSAGEANQIMAYQLVSPPSVPYATQPPPPPQSPVLEVAHVAQTQRPASWLSRPSLLANAIFHSFKPYLSPNRQRPTYRPFIGGGGFRPQQLRPTVLNSPHPHRPHLFLPINHSANNNQQSIANHHVPPNASHNNHHHHQQITPSANEPASVQNSTTTTMQQDNNDHHIVNPSTMTDRRRPADNGRPPMGLLSNGHKLQAAVDNHHEMLGGAQQISAPSDSSMIKVTSDYNLATAQNNSSSVAASNDAQLGGYLIDLNNANKTFGIQQANSSSDSNNNNNSNNSNVNSPMPIYDYNNSQAHGYSLANNTLNVYQQQQPQPQQTTVANGSGPLTYPSLISSALGTSPIPDAVGPIDEIYGLIDGNQHQQDSQSTTGATTLELGQSTASSIVSAGGGGGGGVVVDQQRPHQTSVALSSGGIGVGIGIGIGSSSSSNSSPFPESQTSQSSVPNATWTMPAATNPPPLPTTTPAPIRPAGHHHRVPPPSLAPLSAAPGGSLREATCGVTGLYPQTKVVGGKNAAFGAWPWQVSVRKVSFFGFSSMHRCGGAVISSEWIATAGHCVQDLALQSIRIRVGEYDFETITEPYPHLERNARKKIVHPDYNTYTYENDLALIQLDQPLQFSTHVAPICLPPDNIDLVGRNATVTGWGRLNEGGSLPSILQEVIVPIVSNDKCRDMFLRAGRPEYIPDIFLCAGYEEGGRDSCQGDSGGPLQVRGDDGRWMLAGIISWGIGCAEPLLVGVCSAIQRFKPWITATISGG